MPSAERAARDLAADPAETEHAERLAGELDSREPPALPRAGGQRRVRLGDVAREREQQRDRVLRRGIDGRLGRVRDDDATARRCVDVDVVDADPCAADDLQPRRALDERRVERRRRADDDRVEVADDLREVGVAVLDDVEAAPEELEARLGDRLADEDARRSETRAASWYASSARSVATPGSIAAPRSTSSVSTAVSAVVMSSTS